MDYGDFAYGEEDDLDGFIEDPESRRERQEQFMIIQDLALSIIRRQQANNRQANQQI